MRAGTHAGVPLQLFCSMYPVGANPCVINSSSWLRGQCGVTALLATTGPLGPQRSAEGYRSAAEEMKTVFNVILFWAHTWVCPYSCSVQCASVWANMQNKIKSLSFNSSVAREPFFVSNLFLYVLSSRERTKAPGTRKNQSQQPSAHES